MPEEIKNCPDCKQPGQSRRYVKGAPNLICGNGHNWPQYHEPKKEAPTEEQPYIINIPGLITHDDFLKGIDLKRPHRLVLHVGQFHYTLTKIWADDELIYDADWDGAWTKEGEG